MQPKFLHARAQCERRCCTTLDGSQNRGAVFLSIVDPEVTAGQYYDVCIVGAGPAGLAVAFGCAAAGLSTLILESGGMSPNDIAQHGHRAIIHDPKRHAPIERVACRAFGGTSHWWGGICNPFLEREFTAGGWPISYGELAQWYPTAAKFLGCGNSFINETDLLSPGYDDVSFDGISRQTWFPRDLSFAWRRQIEALSNLHVVLFAEVVGLDYGSAQEVSGVRARVAQSPKLYHFSAGTVVLAAAGLGTTRILLAEQMRGVKFEGSKHLGRYYMGHLTGTGSRIRMQSKTSGWGIRCPEKDDHIRERIVVGPGKFGQCHSTAFWIGNVPLWDAEHRSGGKSAKYLLGRVVRALRSTWSAESLDARLGLQRAEWRPHLANVGRHPVDALRTIARALKKVTMGGLQRLPDYPEPERDGTYALWYHAEQLPSAENMIQVEGPVELDVLPPLSIRFGFSEDDVDLVVQAHLRLKEVLSKSEGGASILDFDPEKLAEGVRKSAYDGYHQIGTTRMAATPEKGMVDGNCKVFGLNNLYVASASAFPNSGQPNPTLTIVALAQRLAAHISNRQIQIRVSDGMGPRGIDVP